MRSILHREVAEEPEGEGGGKGSVGAEEVVERGSGRGGDERLRGGLHHSVGEATVAPARLGGVRPRLILALRSTRLPPRPPQPLPLCSACTTSSSIRITSKFEYKG
ncbi:hypothetical protein B296_00045525 [Ensete ventricosum]|uniref:Uncharacterized protein n=1 Tax=Ensete ventricosum TaxID=4639 RepID=A0A426YZX1_ENSVE|nr:hypothetical protein B296_00045525 [Ensete ventricosum]